MSKSTDTANAPKGALHLATGSESAWKPMRAAFVAMIKEENFYSDWSKQSLRAHWSGAEVGFGDESLQRRYKDFCAGWKAASSPNDPHDPRGPKS